VEAHSGRCTAAGGDELLRARLGEALLEQLVCQARVGEARLRLQRERGVGADLSEALVDLGVHAGDEEGGDGVDAAEVVTVRAGLLESGEVGVDDLAVALEREDQGHVDRDARGESRGDRGQARLRRGDLDERVRAVDLGPQLLRLGGRRGRVMREVGETSIDTRPSTPPVASNTGRKMSAASATSVVVISKIASSAETPCRERGQGASYESSSLLPIAAWKIDGFVVTPDTSRVLMRSARLPESMRLRERSSSQMLTPAAARSCVGVLMRCSP
jgi:hypothetical protein